MTTDVTLPESLARLLAEGIATRQAAFAAREEADRRQLVHERHQDAEHWRDLVGIAREDLGADLVPFVDWSQPAAETWSRNNTGWTFWIELPGLSRILASWTFGPGAAKGPPHWSRAAARHWIGSDHRLWAVVTWEQKYVEPPAEHAWLDQDFQRLQWSGVRPANHWLTTDTFCEALALAALEAETRDRLQAECDKENAESLDCALVKAALEAKREETKREEAGAQEQPSPLRITDLERRLLIALSAWHAELHRTDED